MARLGISRTTIIEAPGGRMLYASPDATGSSFQKLADLRRVQIENLSEPVRQFGDFLVNVHIPAQIVYQQGTPERFAPLSPAYAMRKARVAPGLPILIFSGDMIAGFEYGERNNQLVIFNRRGYAQYHQTGTSRMPARKYLQIQDDEMGWQKLRQLIRQHVVTRRGP